MTTINDIRSGAFLNIDQHLFQVLTYNHLKLGRGGAIIKVKLKDLKTGAITERSFKNSDSVFEININRKKAQCLYSDESDVFFMDQENFEQYQISRKSLGDSLKFLKEGMPVQIIVYDDEIISVDLPIKEVYLVSETPPGVKGDTVSGGNKPATLETGAVVLVPLFIKIGDKIRINTLEGAYVERVS